MGPTAGYPVRPQCRQRRASAIIEWERRPATLLLTTTARLLRCAHHHRQNKQRSRTRGGARAVFFSRRSMMNGVRAKTPGKIRAAAAQRAFSAVGWRRAQGGGIDYWHATTVKKNAPRERDARDTRVPPRGTPVGSHIFPVRPPHDESSARAPKLILFHIITITITIIIVLHDTRRSYT